MRKKQQEHQSNGIIEMPESLIYYRGISSSCKIIMAIIMHECRKNGSFEMTNSELAKKFKINIQGVSNWFTILTKAKLISISYRKSDISTGNRRVVKVKKDFFKSINNKPNNNEVSQNPD